MGVIFFYFLIYLYNSKSSVSFAKNLRMQPGIKLSIKAGKHDPANVTKYLFFNENKTWKIQPYIYKGYYIIQNKEYTLTSKAEILSSIFIGLQANSGN